MSGCTQNDFVRASLEFNIQQNSVMLMQAGAKTSSYSILSNEHFLDPLQAASTRINITPHLRESISAFVVHNQLWT